MSINGSMVIRDRMMVLARNYLNAEVDKVDTGANAENSNLAEANFTTPDVASGAIQARDDDTQGLAIRCIFRVVQPPTTGRLKWNNADTSSPRVDGIHRIGVLVVCAKVDGSWTDDGAERRCDRVATALKTLFMGVYPQLPVAADTPALAKLNGLAVLECDDQWANEGEDGTADFVARRALVFDVKRLEVRT